MIAKLFAELFGTFVFLGIILATGDALPIAIGLMASILLVGKISGANLNPAVSTMLWAKGDLSGATCAVYIFAQVVGGLLALAWYKSSTTMRPHKIFYNLD